jgi:hypothetical protein
MVRLSVLPLLLFLAACGNYEPPVGYYDGRWSPPEIGKLSSDSQVGNVGGQTVTISGAGFGDDPSKVLVQFGSHNATVVSGTDDTLTVVVPAGPVGGGAVVVTVATATGYASTEYTYDLGHDLVEGAGDVTPDAVGYVLVSNYWESCFGGLSSRLNEEYGVEDCEKFAYLGYTGLAGSAEGLDFGLRRLHAGSQGWSGASDVADGEWRVERPSENPYIGGLDEFRVDLGTVTLTNPYWSDDEGYCVDLAETASYRYGGGSDEFPEAVSITGDGLPAVSRPKDGDCADGSTWYAPDELQFCARNTAENVPDHIYEADWPVNENFFESNSRKLEQVTVALDMSAVGVEGVELTLPPPLVVYNTEGYDDILTDGSAPGAQDLWAAYGAMQHCFADRSSGERLDDVAFTFEWPVADTDLTRLDNDVIGARTYVRMSITELTLGWFGGINYPVRATVTVPDEYDTYKTTGSDGRPETRSRLTVPSSVMYQLPTIYFPAGGGLGGEGLVSSTDGRHLGYMFIEFQRVTEYTIASSAGPVVFAYVTGDFGFTEWINPTQDACHDCLDGDRDGWIDDDDPDCASGVDEVGLGSTACNDGVDNDGDGLVDAEDEDCTSAADDDETNCNNGLDDDGDGFEDDDDADCAAGRNESLPDGCVDGIDNDGDGWADAADPDCLAGLAEVGFGDGVCNDGVDNDGDLLVDADDPECANATSPSEEP